MMLLRVVQGADLGSAVVVERPTLIGRGTGDLRLSDPEVSRRHVRASPATGGIWVEDLGSSGGISIDGEPVRSGLLRPASVLGLGRTLLRALVPCQPTNCEDAVLVVDGGGASRQLPAGAARLAIGRDGGSDLVVEHPTVSRRHAELRRVGAGWGVVDLGSSNGTRVNGELVRALRPLLAGDEVRFGESPEVVRVVGPVPERASDVALRVGIEGEVRRWAVTVHAGRHTQVAEVVAQLAAYLGLAGEGPLLGYRTADGVVLPGEVRWPAAGVRDGDELLIGRGAAPAVAAPPPLPPRLPVVRMNQLPRQHLPPGEHTARAPDHPDSTSLRGRGLLWQVAGGSGIVLSGAVLAVIRPGYAVFALLMVVVGVISVLASIMGEQSRRRYRHRQWRSQIRELDRELGLALTRQQGQLRRASPDDDELVQLITRHSTRLWERRPSDPDALRLRLGTGDVPALVRVDDPMGQNRRRPGGELDEVLGRHRHLRAVPVRTPGLGVTVVGLVGDAQRVTDLAARMLIEAAALHPPDQLRIWVLADSPGWAWARWLPHTHGGHHRRVARDLDGCAAIAHELLEALPPPAPQGGEARREVLDLVVVTAGAARIPVVARAVRRFPPDAGQVIALGGDVRDLPSGVAVIAQVDATGSLVLTGAVPDPPAGPVRAAGFGPALAEELAAALAPLSSRPANSRSTSPQGLVELISGRDVATVDVAAVWAARHLPRLQTPVGLADDGGPLVLGLREDGPHGMIAGTTGSGKSEFLQTVLAGLCLAHPPEDLNLFLIDFKGGATFRPLEELPHVVGVVTDIEADSSLAARAFTSLEAELDRRKRLLDQVRVPNIIEYHRSGDDVPEPLADLLVVIDEFALLVKSQPEVRERLDTVTAQGRSLGVHLLLATQTPSGVVTAAIRANTNLWVALRVVSDAESIELIGRKDAARIPGDQPGRGFVRRGASDAVTGFRAARIARPVQDGGGAPVVVAPFVDDAPRPQAPHSVAGHAADHGLTELEVLGRRIIESARATGRPRGRQLWSPPLPAELPAVQLPAARRDPQRLQIVLGLTDRPERQASEPTTVDLTAEGNALVVGVLGSGKTTLLLQAAYDVAQQRSPAEAHIYGIDAGGASLAPLAALPHCGAVVGVGDAERLQRLLARLSRLVDERQHRLAEAGGGGGAARWSTGPSPAPWILVLLDDYAAFREAAESIDGGQLVERFSSLLRSGPAVGVHFVVAASQSTDLRVTQQNLIGFRLLLRPADVLDGQLLDLRLRSEQFGQWPPGRGALRGGHLVQVALPDLAAVDAISRAWGGVPGQALPRPVLRLPAEVTREAVCAGSREGHLVLGVGGDEGDPVAVDPQRTGGVVLVMGRNRSGRSTALLSLLEASREVWPDTEVVVLAPRPSPVRALGDLPGVTVAGATERMVELLESLADGPAERGPVVLVVDDAESLPSTMPDRLERILRHAGEWGWLVHLAVRTSDLQGTFGGWSKYVQSLRSGLALQPGQDEAYLLGIRTPGGAGAWPPGRGLWVDGGSATPLQVALPATGQGDRPRTP